MGAGQCGGSGGAPAVVEWSGGCSGGVTSLIAFFKRVFEMDVSNLPKYDMEAVGERAGAGAGVGARV